MCLYGRVKQRNSQSITHTHMTDVCMQMVEVEMISSSHKKVRTKSAEQTKYRREGSEPCVGGLITPV